MDIPTLTAFFMWCTIINGTVFIFWTLTCILVPDMVFRLHSRWFSISRETFNTVIYSFLGLFKIVFLAFSLTPYLALLIIG